MSSIAIVVVGYNRDKSLSRLLNSLSKAYYDDNDIPLIISIDKGDNPKVVDIANDFVWCYGDKIVNVQKHKLGLRDHIIECGNYALTYGSVIVLEDDLYVSKGYYIYAKEAITKYRANGNIAGISLYTHLWNVNCSRPFMPEDDGTDAYFLQFSQSWGQVWTDTMWKDFYDWYVKNQDKINDEPDMPKYVTAWPDSSWLKYHIRYLVKNNKFFVYPRISLTTNFGDRGQHTRESYTTFQVPLLRGVKFKYDLPELGEDTICYDAFFERIGTGKILGLPEEQVCFDLYSTKNNASNKRYWVTMEQANYRILSCYALNMRPHEANIFNHIEGNDIYCYDTSIVNNNNFIDGYDSNIKLIKYDLRGTNRKLIWIYGHSLFIKLLRNAFKKISKLL